MQQRGDRKRLMKGIMQFLRDDLEISRDLNAITEMEFDSYTKKINEFFSYLFPEHSTDSSCPDFTTNKWEEINLFLIEFYSLNAITEQTKKDIRFMLDEVIM